MVAIIGDAEIIKLSTMIIILAAARAWKNPTIRRTFQTIFIKVNRFLVIVLIGALNITILLMRLFWLARHTLIPQMRLTRGHPMDNLTNIEIENARNEQTLTNLLKTFCLIAYIIVAISLI